MKYTFYFINKIYRIHEIHEIFSKFYEKKNLLFVGLKIKKDVIFFHVLKKLAFFFQIVQRMYIV